MPFRAVVHLISVEQGKNKNWLEFQAYVGVLNRNQTYTITFNGTDLDHGLALPEQQLEQLKEQMCNDFGYAPFDLEEAKRTLGSGKGYTLT